ncbi:MAG: FprA family A-type flavoprotein [Eubacteriales bacterium]|nr:FprA family A-type flavoprotein [Eubacteriales bacterium]
MNEIKISDSIKYIGVSTYDIDLFEGQYDVPNGMAYNSYVILDDKIAVMDTADSIVSDEWMSNLKNALEGRTPDYLVVHHLEPDHSANISNLIKMYPDIKIVCTAKAKQMMPQFADIDSDSIITKGEGDTLELGSHTLHFMLAPMIHWPEVMVSYESEEKVLFSADAFGKFGALDADEGWSCEARRYYFNIVGKYGKQVQVLLKKASALEINTICPLHGPVLTDTIPEVIDLYSKWSAYEPENEGVFIAYASIYGNTAKAAEKMKEMLEEKGCPRVAIADLARDDMAECVEDAFRHSTLLCMASSYDGGVFTPMSDFIHHLKAKAFQNRRVAFVENGSWAPSAARTMKAEFEQMSNITIVDDVVTIKTTVKDADIQALDSLAEILK